MNTLRIHNLSKTYPNGVRALNDINLEITNGMFGLLGANGAGKSSLMRTIASLQEPTSGSISFNGSDIIKKPEVMRKYLGYLPQEFGVYPKISAEKLLNHLAVLKGILDAKQRKEHVTALLQQVNLYQHRKKSVYTFSGGMRQRFGIAQALLGNPKLIIVDEPTAGLDPEESNRFLNLLSEIGENVIVILSTHIVEDVRNLCPKMAILSNGEIISEGNPKDLVASIEGKIWTKTVPKKDIEGYKKTFDVISTKLVAGETQLSVLSDHKPEDGFEAITPNLEDFYFAILFKNSTKKQQVMFTRLLKFEVFYQLKQRAFPIFTVLFLFLGFFVGRQGFAPTGVNYNSVYQVYFHTSLFTLGSVFIIMFFAISAMLRDKQYLMEQLIFSSSIQKAHYYWSRFIGTFVFSVLAFTPFILGYIFGNYFSELDAERLGDFQLLTYVQPWLYIVVPNIFVCSAVVFSVCTLTKNSTATYVSAVFVYMLYFVSSLFLNSPLLVQAVPASPESMAIAAIADPFGIAAFFEQTQYWTPFQKNSQLLSFSGLFLWNRLVWIAVGLGILCGTYRLFSFRKIAKKVKKAKKITSQNTPLVAYKPLQTLHNAKAQYFAFFSLLKMELKSVFKGLPFIAVLIMWLVIVFSELYSTVISGGEYGVSQYPFTNQLISLIVNPLTLFSLILIIFYCAEIVWKERSIHFNLIVDALPTKNSVFFLSKFFAILLLPVILITTGIIMCILFQISLNYTNFELGLYASLYYHYGLQLAIFSMIGLFIGSLAKTKYLGMGVFGFFVLLCLKSDTIGLEHPLTSLGFMPRMSYSNMNGFYGGLKLYRHLSIYWLAFGLLIMLVTFKIWNRGVVANFSTKLKLLKRDFTNVQKVSFSFLFVVGISFGGLVFYNVNFVSDYETADDSLEFREQYEKKYKQYQDLVRPYSISRKTEVAIFPEEQRYTIKADYVLKNGGEQPISKVFVTQRLPLETIAIENANLVTHDSVYGIYIFQFEKPLQPNHTVGYNFKLKHHRKGYAEDKTIVNNGTYITHTNFEPILGYSSGLEITDKVEREKRNLPKREVEIISDAHIALEDFNNEKTDFETIVSTSSKQTALSSGNLVKKWAENNRNYYHYKTKNKVVPMIAYFSADYKTKKVDYQGISIEQYFDEAHSFNIEDIENSAKQTIDYCEENFGDYAFDHIRIAEVPSHWSFGGFAHPGMVSMVEDRLYLMDVSQEETFNLVAKRVIHEVAHQYWGHTLSAKPVAGGAVLIEGFAKYTEAVVMEKMYGKRAVYALSENARRRYFSGRSFATDLEPPVYKVHGQGYISYGKALNVMLALRDLIGEEQLNRVLKKITDIYRNSATLEANTIEFLDLVYKATPKEHHHLIDDWFKKIITYNLSIEDSSYRELENGTYEITATVKSKRFETIGNGEIIQRGINEPIKIGAFTTHPSMVKEDSSVLYYESYQINKEVTEIKFIVSEIPNYIAIDPYGTRSDENLVDNVFRF